MPVYRLSDDLVFPPPWLADDGLLAMGGDLSRERLLLAYRSGIFPWYSPGDPILWWSPDPRMILKPEQMHVSQSLRRALKKSKFRFTADTVFPEVIRGCAKIPRKKEHGTWITSAMEAAYIDLHEAGFAHSIEVWHGDELAGGLYGVSLGACFFGESMFSREAGASKAALAVFAQQCLRWGITLIDCQVANAHLHTLGAYEISRREFLHALNVCLKSPTRRGPWTLDDDLDIPGN
jgi:leucyl/phenylalanyl-tRNA--protein transferase